MAFDPSFSNVVLLCHFDGTNGSTTVVDSSSAAHVITGSASLPLSTAQAKFGASSLSHPTSAGQITTPDSPDWCFGSGQFTVELWIYPTVAISGTATILAQWIAAPNLGWIFGFNGSSLWFPYSTTGSDVATFVAGTFVPTVGAWSHIAADRDAGNNTRLYANGAVIANWLVNPTFFDSSAPLYIGNDGSSTQGFVGYMDDLRITKGVARYAGAFTPPTAPFPDSGPVAAAKQYAVSVVT